MEKKTLPEKLFLLSFKVDKTSHLVLNKEFCLKCAESERACLWICPSEVYKWDAEKKDIIVGYEGCLECGTCRIACSSEALDWRNPRGGFGVAYRFG